jgi:hypothetical protein
LCVSSKAFAPILADRLRFEATRSVRLS